MTWHVFAVLESIYVVDYSYWFMYIESFLCFWDEVHLFMEDYFWCVHEFGLQVLYGELFFIYIHQNNFPVISFPISPPPSLSCLCLFFSCFDWFFVCFGYQGNTGFIKKIGSVTFFSILQNNLRSIDNGSLIIRILFWVHLAQACVIGIYGSVQSHYTSYENEKKNPINNSLRQSLKWIKPLKWKT